MWKKGRKEGNKWVEKMRKVVPAPAAVHSIACMHKRREAVRIGIGYGNGKWEMKASKERTNLPCNIILIVPI